MNRLNVNSELQSDRRRECVNEFKPGVWNKTPHTSCKLHFIFQLSPGHFWKMFPFPPSVILLMMSLSVSARLQSIFLEFNAELWCTYTSCTPLPSKLIICFLVFCCLFYRYFFLLLPSLQYILVTSVYLWSFFSVNPPAGLFYLSFTFPFYWPFNLLTGLS